VLAADISISFATATISQSKLIRLLQDAKLYEEKIWMDVLSTNLERLL
jgi:hypothetical protein